METLDPTLLGTILVAALILMAVAIAYAGRKIAEAFGENATTIKTLSETITTLEEMRRKYLDEMTLLRIAHDTLTERIDDQDTQIKAQTVQIEMQDKVIADQTKGQAENTKQIEALVKENNRLTKRVKTLETERKQLLEQVSDLRGELAASETLRREAESASQQAQVELVALRDKIERLEQRINGKQDEPSGGEPKPEPLPENSL